MFDPLLFEVALEPELELVLPELPLLPELPFAPELPAFPDDPLFPALELLDEPELPDDPELLEPLLPLEREPPEPPPDCATNAGEMVRCSCPSTGVTEAMANATARNETEFESHLW